MKLGKIVFLSWWLFYGLNYYGKTPAIVGPFSTEKECLSIAEEWKNFSIKVKNLTHNRNVFLTECKEGDKS